MQERTEIWKVTISLLACQYGSVLCKPVKNIICALFFSLCFFLIFRASFLRSNCTAELKRGCLQGLQVSPHLALSLENMYEPALTRRVRVRVCV